MKIDQGTERLTELMRKVAEVRKAQATRKAQAASKALAQAQAARTRVSQGEARAEAELLGDGRGVSAAMVQLVSSARQVHQRRMAALEQTVAAHGEVASAREDERLAAARRHMGATRIAEYVKVSRQTSVQQAAQVELEELSRGRGPAVEPEREVAVEPARGAE